MNVLSLVDGSGYDGGSGYNDGCGLGDSVGYCGNEIKGEIK